MKRTRRMASPIPGDAWISADEKPFTAFGQFGYGKLDIRVFEQDIWWVDIAGHQHVLAAMSQDYLRNVLIFLFEGAHSFHLTVIAKRAIEFADAAVIRGDEAYLSFLAHESRIPSGTIEWLRSTPLVKRIDNLLSN